METFHQALLNAGISASWASAATVLLALIGALIAGNVLYFCAQKVVYHMARPAQQWQDAIQRRHAPRGMAWSLAALLAYFLVLPQLASWPLWQQLATRLLEGLLVLLVALTLSRLMAATIEVLETKPDGQRLPFKVLGQALQIVLWSYASVVLLSVLTDRDVSTLLTGMTAIGAVLVYVFRDSILGWVAGVQIVGNDLARHGDWISVPGHGADGEVIDIALTTIKVRNWDKTISTIPSYALVSEGFRNWRGMFDAGGRRISRVLAIDASSVLPCDSATLERLSQSTPVGALRDRSVIDSQGLTDSPAPTNLGYYRRWLHAWLVQQPGIREDMTAMVRELASEGRGIRLEIYAFSSDTRWQHYELLQADLYDYALAMLPEFGLRVFQEPSGADLRAASRPETS